MGTGVPFIFQVVLLIGLPLAFAYLICVAGLVVVTIHAMILRNKSRPPRDFPSELR